MIELPRSLNDLMADLDRLLGNQPSLRRNLQWYVDAGKIFVELKTRCRHKEFDIVLAKVCEMKGIRPRTAKEWMHLAANVRLAASLDLPPEPTCSDFLAALRAGKKEIMQLDREKERDEALEKAAPEDERFKVHRADCRKFKGFPKNLTMIVTDPPWKNLKAYEWLAGFSAEHLKDGGLLLVQVGQEEMARTLPVLVREERLTYLNCFAIIYPSIKRAVTSMFMNHWRPVLLFSKGKWSSRSLKTKCADGWKGEPPTKRRHKWQQPVAPFENWIRLMTPAGASLADPFCGLGTTGVATKRAGAGRTWTGTDWNYKNVHIARQEIDAAKEFRRKNK